MAMPADSLICPITLELLRDPVLAQDGHTYEREAIQKWIEENGTSPITRQQLSIEHLHPNFTVKQLVATFEKSLQQKNYQFTLDVDVRKKKGRSLFQTYGKTIYNAEWLPNDSNQPEIILLKIDGARALKEASFYVNMTRHPHVVRTFGFVLDKNNHDEDNSIMLVQEYASEGSLNELVRERRKPLDEKILIEMFLQIIEAMIFLAYNHVVHGDLACRNVLVFRFDETNPKNNIVKVANFGLTRQSALYSKTSGSADTILDIIPIRYAAPEILAENSKPDNYTEKSDVYSMGVLMWEAYSRGALPWSTVEKDTEVIQNVLNSVYLPQPSNCGSKYWDIMVKTWSKLPEDRPTFNQLKGLLAEQNHMPVLSSSVEQKPNEPVNIPVEVKHVDTASTVEIPATSDTSLANKNRTSSNDERMKSGGTIIKQSDNIPSTQNKTATPQIPAKTVEPPPRSTTINPTALPQNMNQKREYLCKVLIIGEIATGKKALVKRYVNSFSPDYYQPFPAEFVLKIVKHNDDTLIRLQLWNIAGQERFGRMTPFYCRNAVGCVIVFDVTRGSTFEAVTKWKADLDNKVQLPDGSPVPCVLLANKCDLTKERLVNNAQQMDEFCKEKGFAKWFETSARADINVESSFRYLINELMKNPQHLQQIKRETDAGSNTTNVTNRGDAAKKSTSNCFGGNSSNH